MRGSAGNGSRGLYTWGFGLLKVWLIFRIRFEKKQFIRPLWVINNPFIVHDQMIRCC